MTWVFAYGSVIWRPGFPFEERLRAVLPGYTRRFWQGSPDHRGTLAAPGRVVTLVPMSDCDCEGVAFLLPSDAAAATIQSLDVRESGGYERTMRRVRLADGRVVAAIVYIADPHNPYYLGPAPLSDMVALIERSHGPSGENVDYLLNLKGILENEGIVDDHIITLAKAVSF